MKEIPIIFSTPMVQAILAGNKTMTRRVVKPQPLSHLWDTIKPEIVGAHWCSNINVRDENGVCYSNKCPYGQSGDRLWVRETWFCDECDPDCAGREDGDECPFNRVGNFCYGYKAQYKTGWHENIKWRPSIFMPKEAARIWLEVVSVRVERLQDITEADCYKEGIRPESVLEFRNRTGKGTDHIAKADFKNLWDTINAKRGYGWDSNPWVWRVEFKRVTDMQRMGRGS